MTSARSSREGSIPVFDALHRRQHVSEAGLYAFDLLELNGEDLRPRPLGERKARLEKLLGRKTGAIVYNEHTDEDGATVFRHACKLGFEGHRVEAAGGALPIRAVSGLDQGQEPGQPGDAAASVGAMVNDRRSPAPWRADKIAGGYVVRDANGQALVYVYSRDNDAEALQARVLTKDEARRIAINAARLPQLLGKSD
jgi:hypothetical protein